MDVLSLNSSLKQLAISNGLCQEWQDEWKEDTSIDGLMKKFLRGIDFYLSNRFISKRQMLLWFSPDDMFRHNIVVDNQRSILNPRSGIAVGNSKVTIRCNGHSVCRYYACDNAHVSIVMRDSAHLSITLCDNAVIDRLQTDGVPSHVYICRAGENTKAVYGDSINVKDNFELYKDDK